MTGKTLGEMTPAERHAAVSRAVSAFQDELIRTAPAIGAALESAEAAPSAAVSAPARVQVTTRYHGPSYRASGTCRGSYIRARVTTPRTAISGRTLSTPYDHAEKQGDHAYAVRALASKYGADPSTVEFVAMGADARGAYQVYAVSLESAQ